MKIRTAMSAILRNANSLIIARTEFENKINIVMVKFKAYGGFSLGYRPSELDPKWKSKFHMVWYRRFWPMPRWCLAPQKD